MFCGRVISKALVVSGETEDIADAEQICAEDIGLDAEAVSVPAGHLDYWFDACVEYEFSGGDAGYSNDCGLVVGYVHGIDAAFEEIYFFIYKVEVGTFGRAEFGCYREVAAAEDFFEIAP